MNKFTNGCLLCGQELDYKEKDEDVTCSYCGKPYNSRVACISGHFVCDHCHSSGPSQLILSHCSTIESVNPMEMAELLMTSPGFNMHGPEHHFLVPAVLTTAYYNAIMNDHERPEEIQSMMIRKLNVAMNRAGNVPGGSCGFHGACGAAVGTGIFISLITDTNPLSIDGWKQANLMTAKVLTSIGEIGGPRCCKRNTFIAIQEAVRFLSENFNIHLSSNYNKVSEKFPTICEFTSFNKECIGLRCPFFKTNIL